MQLDVTRILKNIEGKPFKETGEKSKDLTLGKACVGALLYIKNNDTVDGNEKFLRGEIAMRIHGAKKFVDLTIEDIAKIKTLVGDLYGPMLILRIWEILEQKKGVVNSARPRKKVKSKKK